MDVDVPPRDRTDRLVVLALCAIIVAVFGRAIAGDFLDWDDDRFLVKNPLFHAGGWTYVRAAWTQVQFEAYQPLHLLSYLPDRALWPDDPAGFHALNVAIYAVDVALAYALCRGHVGRGAAALACLVVALHPLCAEPVAWITSRKDLVALGAFLGVLLVEDRRPITEARPHPLAVALALAAMLAKSATVCLPLVLIAGLRWLRGASWRVAIGRALPALVAAAVLAALVATVWSAHDMIPWARPDAAPIDVAATIATYGARTLVPTHLSPIYPAEAPHPVLGAVVVGLGLLAAALTWRRWPGVARFALWAWLAALAPTANLVPVWFRFADRYALLALYTLVVPLAIGLGALAHRLGRAPARIGLAVLALALAGEGIATATQVGVWHDSTTLWTHAVLAQPDARNALYKLGEIRRDRGDWPGAIAAYQRAIRLDPDSPLGYAGLFYTYARRAEAQGAIAAGTADRWLAALGPALATPRAMAALLAEIPHAACAPCANLVLGLGLRQWPQPDAGLLAAATDALDHGQPDVALVYLTSVRDPDAPAAAALIARARAASP